MQNSLSTIVNCINERMVINYIDFLASHCLLLEEKQYTLLKEMADLKNKIEYISNKNEDLEEENAKLLKKISVLENQVVSLKNSLYEKQICEPNNIEAQSPYETARIFYKKKNYKQALEWYKKSAEIGNADAQYQLGLMYYLGEGVKENNREAYKWYKKAAEQGHKRAQEAYERMSQWFSSCFTL